MFQQETSGFLVEPNIERPMCVCFVWKSVFYCKSIQLLIHFFQMYPKVVVKFPSKVGFSNMLWFCSPLDHLRILADRWPPNRRWVDHCASHCTPQRNALDEVQGKTGRRWMNGIGKKFDDIWSIFAVQAPVLWEEFYTRGQKIGKNMWAEWTKYSESEAAAKPVQFITAFKKRLVVPGWRGLQPCAELGTNAQLSPGLQEMTFDRFYGRDH